MREQWPCTLWIVRHGQSAGNVARDAAEAAGHHVIDIAERDIDTPLSELGRKQALALGHWFGELPADRRPQVVLCSPYVRARQTAHLLLRSAGISEDRVRLRFDERLREKEFGILDRLTVHGIRQKY
ncbi:MAG TPA: histidine phosphatase family protein, partial [Ramlibacter sp.]|nr:histidine phosphatase family protein [Ramlibacter sp.]